VNDADSGRKPLVNQVREISVAGALFLTLTLILTYPLSVSPHRTVLAHGPDDQEVMWILGWDVHALVHQPFSMFDANILYPERKTLAYAENLIGSALFAAPVMWLTGNLVMAVNVVALLSCALCGLGAYVLSRRPGLSVEELLNFPNQSSVQRRQDAGVTFIVVHTDDYPAERRHRLDEQLRAFSSRLTLVYMDPAGRVYSVRASRAVGN